MKTWLSPTRLRMFLVPCRASFLSNSTSFMASGISTEAVPPRRPSPVKSRRDSPVPKPCNSYLSVPVSTRCSVLRWCPVVCQAGATVVEARSRGAFAFVQEALRYYALTSWCLLHCQASLIYSLVVTELWGYYRRYTLVVEGFKI